MTRFLTKAPAMMRHIATTSLAVLLSLSTASLAGTPANALGSAPPPAKQSAPRPVWPDNGIAQRRFPGAFNMFVENDHGKWHAWVMSGLGAHDAKALDFFSGKVMKVTAQLDEDTQQQDFSFTDAAGNDHFPRGTKFEVESTRDLPAGLAFSPYVPPYLELGSADGCDVDLGAIDGGEIFKWSKVAIYRDVPAYGSCTDGRYASGFENTLDLGDGTFLAHVQCWVFRLRVSDLTPVGAAPGLRIVDAAAIRRAIDAANDKEIKDASAYLAKVLHLGVDNTNSCK